MQQHVEIEGETQKTLAETLFHRYAPAIFVFLRQQSPSREDAEDILLEVFTAVLEQKRLGTLSPDEQRSLLWRTTRNKLVDAHRRKMRRPSISMELFLDNLLEDTEQVPEQELLRMEEYAQLHSVLQRLSPLQQRILHMY